VPGTAGGGGERAAGLHRASRRWLIERRRIGPVLRAPRRDTDPLFRQAGIDLDGDRAITHLIALSGICGRLFPASHGPLLALRLALRLRLWHQQSADDGGNRPG
jgi:hypothetical protein